MKVTLLENMLQPLVDEALELSNTAESQLKLLKTYDTFAQERANTESSSVLQELVEKEKVADDILHNLTNRFHTLAQKILPPEPSQSVPGWATSESWGPVGTRTLRIISFGNSAVVFVSRVTSQNSLRGVGVSQSPFL